MADLYEFPYLESPIEKNETSIATFHEICKEKIRAYLKDKFTIEGSFQTNLPKVRHTFTRFRSRSLWIYLENCKSGLFKWL